MGGFFRSISGSSRQTARRMRLAALCIAAVVAIAAIVALSFHFRMSVNYTGPLETVEAFYNNSYLDPELDCTKVYPVSRQIPKTGNLTQAAVQSLEKLFGGPTYSEAQKSYFTSFNSGVKVNHLDIRNGTAYVDFSPDFNRNISGSCRLIAMNAQVTQTLEQFPGITGVVISVDGKTQ